MPTRRTRSIPKKAAPRKKRAGALRLDVVMRAINEGVYDWDIVSNTVYYSDWVRRAMGLSAEELKTGEDWRSRIHPDDIKHYDAAIIAHLKGATERLQCDYRYRSKDGTWHWARQHGFALRDAKGRAIRLIGSTGDITELKNAENALKASEERYALAMRAATEGVYEWDVPSGRLYVPDTTKVFFWSKEQFLTPAAWNERIHPDDYAGYRSAIVRHFKGDTPQFEHEYRIGDASGGWLWVLDRGIGVRDAHGRVTKFVGAVSDITRRKLAEQELRRAHDETTEALEQQTATAEILRVIGSSPADTQPVFEAIVKSALHLFGGLGVAVVLAEGGLIQLVASGGGLFSDESARKRFPMPLSRESVSGQAILGGALVHIPDTEAAGAPEYARGNGRALGFRAIAGAPMVRESAPIGAIIVMRRDPGPLGEKQLALLRTFADQAVIAIENVRLFHEVRAKSAELEAANRHKSEFLANMSHELRTPLNAVIGFSEALGERYFGELNDKQDEYVRDIHASGKHLLSLINDILDLSKIEAGRMELEASEFDLPAAIDNAVTLVKERAQRHGIALRREIDPALARIHADERKLKQILLNLLSNAVKFTPDGGTVTIRAQPRDGMVEIAVADSGPGIAQEDQAAVFEEFKQVGPASVSKTEGTGLGLPLAKRFVELHGGAMRLESAPGKGATFSFTFPLR